MLLTSNLRIMMNLLAQLLLIAFMAVASAQTCTLCPKGEPPRFGNVAVYELDGVLLTCKAIAQDILDNPPVICGTYDAYAAQSMCGCRGVKPGSCPGICATGSFLTKPDQLIDPVGFTCLLVDQFLRGEPGDTTCPVIGGINYKDVCICKAKATPSPNNMGNGGMMGMSSGRKLRNGLEEHFPLRSARGLTM